jgi:hypothetical protein
MPPIGFHLHKELPVLQIVEPDKRAPAVSLSAVKVAPERVAFRSLAGQAGLQDIEFARVSQENLSAVGADGHSRLADKATRVSMI